MGDSLAERFLLGSVLGSGATGTVYAAVDTAVAQKVAIKLLHPTLRDTRTRERLRREVRASRPGHSNIVSVFDIHEADGHLFLSMELVEGSSLRSALEKEDLLPIDRVITIGKQVADALTHLHAKGLVHRDVKPGNILLGSDGTVRLCDMGLARPLEEGATVTETEMVVGTPTYMAPEQAIGADLSGASDIYGLGLTLYQALVGEVPLKEQSAIATLSRRQRERPTSMRKRRPECPKWLDRLVRRMLEPHTQERVSAQETFNALEARRFFPKPRRRTLAIATAVLMIVAAGFAGARLFAHRPTTVVEVGRSSITGRDGTGRTSWHRELESPVISEQRADLNGDGTEEILLVVRDIDPTNSRSSSVRGPEVWVFENEGEVMTHFRPEAQAQWSFDYAVELQASLHLLDINHDKTLEAVVVGEHVNFFPGVVFIYRPEDNRWYQIMSHPGNILDIRATPPDSMPGIRFIAVNNRLGVLGFVGEIHVGEFGSTQAFNVRAQVQRPGLQSPPFGSASPAQSCRWSAYVPLPQHSGTFLATKTIVSELPDGGIQLLSSPGETLTFDKYWNLAPGPNAGRDLRTLRMAFMDELYFFSPEIQQLSPTSVIGKRSEMQRRFEPLFSEPVYQLILDLKSARALARADNLNTALKILTKTVAQTDHTDAIYRLAHLQALSGDLETAAERLSQMITNPAYREFGTRALFDGPHLALRIGIERRDHDAIDMAVSWLSAEGMSASRVRVAETLRARSRLWWDELQPEDLEVKSWGYAPSGEAIACLGRWRLGFAGHADVAAMEAFIDRNPDARVEGRLALAAALLASNRNAEALDNVSVLEQQLRFPSKDDFAQHQLLDLARAIRVVALDADGQVSRAKIEAHEIGRTLTDDLLPAILVNEVLEKKP